MGGRVAGWLRCRVICYSGADIRETCRWHAEGMQKARKRHAVPSGEASLVRHEGCSKSQRIHSSLRISFRGQLAWNNYNITTDGLLSAVGDGGLSRGARGLG